MNRLIIAVDFDGTVVRHSYPDVGEDIGAIPWLLKLVDAGARLVLWTMRDGKELEDAERWFEENRIPLWGVQRNPQQDGWTSSPKAYAHVYVDDAALGAPLCYHLGRGRGFIDWSIAGPVLLKMAEES